MPSTEDYIAAGLFDPADSTVIGRLELLEWLHVKGFTIDEMVTANENYALGAMAGDRHLQKGPLLTLAEAAEVGGIDAADMEINAVAFGFMVVDGAPTGEIGITAEEAHAMALFHRLGTMFSDDEATSFLRVAGASVARVAEAAISMFLADVESRLVNDGSSELVLAKKVEEATELLDGFFEQLDPVFRRQVVQAIERSRRTMIDFTERYQYRYAIGFVDLVGFTAISGEMDSKALSEFLREFEGRAHDAVTSAGARVVKLIGDEVMFVASDPAAACRAASELMSGFGAEHDRVLPRGGLAYGDVLVRGGDYYGSVVNLASRLVNEAVPQELLVTEELAEAAPSCSFEPAGRRMVKGFSEPVAVRSLRS